MIKYWIDNKKYIVDDFSAIPFSKLHRNNGPAIFVYDDKEKLEIKEFWINGKCHSINGPGSIIYKNGKLYKQNYWLFHISYSEDEWKFIVDNNMGDIPRKNWPQDFRMIWKLK